MTGPVDISDDMIGLWDDPYANEVEGHYVDMTSSDVYTDMTSRRDVDDDVDENIYEDVKPRDAENKAAPPRPRPPTRQYRPTPQPSGATAATGDTGTAVMQTGGDEELFTEPSCVAHLTTYTHSAKQVVDGLEEEDYGIDAVGTQTVLVRSLEALQVADHIAWRRSAGVWHHAILVDIDSVVGRLSVVHYNGDAVRPEGQKDWASVRHERVQVKLRRKDFYHVLYDPNILRVFPPDEVVVRAFGRLGEANYNPFTNNCEHFARWCKTGQARSIQLENLPQRVQAATDEFVDKVNSSRPLQYISTSAARVPVSKVAHKAGHLVGRGVKGVLGRVTTGRQGQQLAEKVNVVQRSGQQLADKVKVAHNMEEKIVDGLVDTLNGLGLGCRNGVGKPNNHVGKPDNHKPATAK